jgi:hypothetical protein
MFVGQESHGAVPSSWVLGVEMPTQRAEPAMARENDIPVKMDADVVRECKLIAAARGISLAEYLSESMRITAAKDFETEARKRAYKRDQKEKWQTASGVIFWNLNLRALASLIFGMKSPTPAAASTMATPWRGIGVQGLV